MTRKTLEERMRAGFVVSENGCWQWIKCKSRGYGRILVKRENCRAYRVAYELWRGPIPKGMYIDHMCRNRACVNPYHLRIVTLLQNVMENSLSAGALNQAKTHCPQGHPYSGSNLRLWKDKKGRTMRICKECDNARHRVAYREQRASL